MQKLIIFIANTDGGVATYIRTFLQFRTAGRFYVKLVIVNDQNCVRPLLPMNFNANEVRYFSFHRRENLYHIMKKLASSIDGPDDILVCNERLEVAMVNALRLTNPVISIIHGDSTYYYDLVSRYKGVVDGFLATSEWIAQKVRNLAGAEKIICKKILAPVPPIDQKTNSAETPIQILYIGRLDSSKGVQHFPGICRLLDEWGISYAVTVVGEGELSEFLSVESRRLKGAFTFPGFVANEKMGEMLAGKHLFLFPSYSEALGIVVVEAMKGGLIPVVSDLPSGIPEFVLNGITGLTAPVGDELAFARQISWYAGHPDERSVMREKAIEISNRLFDAGRQSAAIEDFILAGIINLSTKQFINDHYGFRLDSRFIPNSVSVFLRRLRDLVQLQSGIKLLSSKTLL